MGSRAAGGLIGVVFGITLCWSGMIDPDVIREALLLENSYLYLMFASAVLRLAGRDAAAAPLAVARPC